MKNELQVTDINSIVRYGEDTVNSVKSVAEKITSQIDNRVDTKNILKSLDSIYKIIDFDELMSIGEDVSVGKVQSFLRIFGSKKDKIVSKYTSVTEKIKSMHLTLKEWEVQLKKNTELYRSMEDELGLARIDMIEKKEFCENKLFEIVETPISDVPEIQKEILNTISQKIQGFEKSILVCDSSILNVKVMQTTNYSIYKKLQETDKNNMPQMEILIAQMIKIKESKEMIQSFQRLDKMTEQLLIYGTKEVIKQGKEASSMCNVKPEDLDVIKSSIQSLKDAIIEIDAINDNNLKQIQANTNKKMIGEV